MCLLSKHFTFDFGGHSYSSYSFHVFSFVSLDDCVLFPYGIYRRTVFSIWRKKHNTNQLNATYNIEIVMASL